MAFRISPLQIGALAHAVRHYPENMQNRWKYIAEYITKRTEGMDLTKVINIGSDKNKRNFEVTALNCRAAYRCLLQHHKDFLHENVNFNNIFLNNDKNCHKPIIMCPPVDNCLLCKKTLRKRESMSFPIVYSEEGVTVAVSVHSRCDPCAVTFHYSYYEKGAKESSQEDRKRLYYYSDALEKKYFQVTGKTAFSIKYLEHVHNQISLGAMSFAGEFWIIGTSIQCNILKRQRNVTKHCQFFTWWHTEMGFTWAEIGRSMVSIQFGFFLCITRSRHRNSSWCYISRW